MFDTHIHRTAPNYPQSVHVKTTEQRAPTDESLRLLKEMQEKARESILSAMRSGPNSFKCTTIVYPDYLSNTLHLRINFRLNETEHERDIELPNSARALNREAWMLLIRDEIAKVIANIIVIQMEHAGVNNVKVEHFA